MKNVGKPYRRGSGAEFRRDPQRFGDTTEPLSLVGGNNGQVIRAASAEGLGVLPVVVEGNTTVHLDGNKKVDEEVQTDRTKPKPFEEIVVEKETREGIRPQVEELETEGGPPLRER